MWQGGVKGKKYEDVKIITYIYTNVVTLIKFLMKLTLSWAEYLELVSQPSNKKHSLLCYLYIYLPTHWLLLHFAFVLSLQSELASHSRSTGWFRTIYFFTTLPLLSSPWDWLTTLTTNFSQGGGGRGIQLSGKIFLYCRCQINYFKGIE